LRQPEGSDARNTSVVNTSFHHSAYDVDVSVAVMVDQWLKHSGKELSSSNAFAHLLLNYAALIAR